MSDRRGMERVGDLIPQTARRLGLEEELRLARAVATWAAIVRCDQVASGWVSADSGE